MPDAYFERGDTESDHEALKRQLRVLWAAAKRENAVPCLFELGGDLGLAWRVEVNGVVEQTWVGAVRGESLRQKQNTLRTNILCIYIYI